MNIFLDFQIIFNNRKQQKMHHNRNANSTFYTGYTPVENSPYKLSQYETGCGLRKRFSSTNKQLQHIASSQCPACNKLYLNNDKSNYLTSYNNGNGFKNQQATMPEFYRSFFGDRNQAGGKCRGGANGRGMNGCCGGRCVNFHSRCNCEIRSRVYCNCCCSMMPSLYHKLISAPYTKVGSKRSKSLKNKQTQTQGNKQNKPVNVAPEILNPQHTLKLIQQPIIPQPQPMIIQQQPQPSYFVQPQPYYHPQPQFYPPPQPQPQPYPIFHHIVPEMVKNVVPNQNSSTISFKTLPPQVSQRNNRMFPSHRMIDPPQNVQYLPVPQQNKPTPSIEQSQVRFVLTPSPSKDKEEVKQVPNDIMKKSSKLVLDPHKINVSITSSKKMPARPSLINNLPENQQTITYSVPKQQKKAEPQTKFQPKQTQTGPSVQLSLSPFTTTESSATLETTPQGFNFLAVQNNNFNSMISRNGQSQISYGQQQRSQQVSYSSTTTSSQSKQVMQKMQQKSLVNQFSKIQQNSQEVEEQLSLSDG